MPYLHLNKYGTAPAFVGSGCEAVVSAVPLIGSYSTGVGFANRISHPVEELFDLRRDCLPEFPVGAPSYALKTFSAAARRTTPSWCCQHVLILAIGPV